MGILERMIDDLLDEESARRHLGPHLQAMRDCVEKGWRQWRQNVAESPSLAKSRTSTRANVVYDHISGLLEEYFDSVGVPTTRKGGYLTAVLADGQIAVRSKKFNHPRRLTTSGVPTAQRRAIVNQQVTLDGAAVTFVNVGYYPDDLGLDLDVVAISCTYGNSLLWSIDLLAEEAITAAIPISHADGLLDVPVVRSTRAGATKEKSEAQ